MAGVYDFLKKNASEAAGDKIGKGFLLFDIANLAGSENKLKGILKIVKDLVLYPAVMKLGFIGLFTAMSKSVRALVTDTGSLEQMLKKLSQIQGLRSAFAPLVGGAEAAKKKVAELVNFASSRKLDLGDTATAAKELLVMTRGAFSSNDALDVLNDTAKATGNSFVGVASAVGQVGAQLRGGQAISSSVEELRQMGVISDATADSLNDLQSSGQDANVIFTTLTQSLRQFKGGAQEAQGDIEQVNKAFELAQANLQEKFASPFVESDVQNTKNMTDAMIGFAPAVENVAGFLAILVNGLSTVKSWIAKTAGESETFKSVLTGAIKVIALVTTGLAAWSAVGLARWLFQASAALGVFSTAARAALITSGIGVAVVALATVAGIIINMQQAAGRAAEALQELRKANDDTNAGIAKQIEAIKTLTDKHEALAKALDNVTAAQLQLNKARLEGDTAKIAEAERNLGKARETADAARGKKDENLAPSDTDKDIIRQRAQRERQQQEQEFQRKMSVASPEKQLDLLRQHEEEARQRAAQGGLGISERARTERESAQTGTEVTDAQKRVEAANASAQGARDRAAAVSNPAAEEAFGGFGTKERQEAIDAANAELSKAKDEAAAARQQLTDAQSRQSRVGQGAAAGTSVALEAERQRVLASNDPDKQKRAAELALKAEHARQLENERGENEATALRDAAQQKQLRREIDISRARANTELEIAKIKDEGFSRSEQEYKLKLDLLAKEKSAEQSREGGADKDALARIEAQKSQTEREQKLSREEFANSKFSVGQEIAKQRAVLKGDSKMAESIDDLSAFTDKFQELIGKGFGREEAGATAKEFAANTVSLDARQQAAGGTIVADSLARIGGGGGVYSGGDKATNLLERQLRLHEREVEYLEVIASTKVGGVK